MKSRILVLVLAALAPFALAQDQAATTAAGNAVAQAAVPAASNSSALAGGTQFDAVLKTMLDTQTAKVGDRVTGETTSAVKQDDNVVIPKGSKLFGHVTQVSAAANAASSSSISVLFDQAVTPQGWSIPVHAVITGMSASGAAAFDNAGMDDGAIAASMPPMPMAAPGGGMVRGGSALPGGVVAGASGALGGTVGAAAPVAGGAMGNVDAPATASLLRASNGAVFSIQPLGASGSAASTTLLTSQHGNLSFDSGSHMQLEEQGSGASH